MKTTHFPPLEEIRDEEKKRERTLAKFPMQNLRSVFAQLYRGGRSTGVVEARKKSNAVKEQLRLRRIRHDELIAKAKRDLRLD